MDASELRCYFQNVQRNGCREISEKDIPMSEYVFNGEAMTQLRTEVRNVCDGIFSVPDNFFRNCFNFDKPMALDLLLELRLRTCYFADYDCHPVPFDIRVLATFGFLMHGHLEYLKPFAAFRDYKEQTLLRCVPQVCQSIVYFMAPAMISFPHNTYELCRNKRSFIQQFGVPGVIGVMDSFFVCLSGVKEEHKKQYTNRLEKTAVKVQVICDQDYRFLDVNARHAAGVSDIYVWKRSHIRHVMQHLYEKDNITWLVADRGYHLEEYVMNPYSIACTSEHQSVNVSLKGVLGTLKKCISMLTARFRCLNSELPFNHEECANIITACATLHNYMIFRGCTIEPNLECEIPKQVNSINIHYEHASAEGCYNREFISRFLFNNNLNYISRLN